MSLLSEWLILKATLIRKNEKKGPVFERAAVFGWLGLPSPSHLHVDYSPFTFIIYSSFTAQCERKTHHFQGLKWKNLCAYQPVYSSG